MTANFTECKKFRRVQTLSFRHINHTAKKENPEQYSVSNGELAIERSNVSPPYHMP